MKIRRRSLFFLIVPTCIAWLAGCGPAPPPPELLTATHVGKAHLENREADAAIAAFEKALELREDAPRLRNLARAHLLAQNPDAALEALARAKDDGGAATPYLQGLALARNARFEEAFPFFEQAASRDAQTAALRFQLARTAQALERHDLAREQLQQALDLDPLHTGAHYRLAGYARKAGDRNAFERHQRELERLRQIFGDEARTPEALERCVYTRAEDPLPERPADAAELRFALDELPQELSEVRAAALFDLDEEGRVVVLMIDASGALLWNGEQVRRLALETPPPADASQLLVGDTHVVALAPSGARLWRRGGVGEELTEEMIDLAGLGDLRATRGAWVDVEHDGDLDLLTAGEAGARLWQNNGDGTFTELGAVLGVEAGDPATDVAVADFEGDVAMDLAIAQGETATRVMKNLRTGFFAPLSEPPGPWPPARRILLDELDDDGFTDAVLLGADEIEIRHVDRVVKIAAADARAAALADADNDGRLELFVADATGVTGLRYGAEWNEQMRIDLPDVEDLLAADFDGDGDGDVLALTAAGPRLLRNDGEQAGGRLKLRLRGTKTNTAGLGTRVEIRREDFLAQRTVAAPLVEFGLGGQTRLDSIRTVWTNGVVDNQIDVDVSSMKSLEIEEKSVVAGSCPYFYAWDGEGFRFVTDLLGNSPIGLSLRRGVPLDADPDEIVEIGPAEIFPPRSGENGPEYVVQVTEELREILYLDEAHLIVVDHPQDVEVHPTDKLMPAPFPASELWPLGDVTPIRAALGDDGVDRTAAMRALDGEFASPGKARPAPLRGQTEPLTLTLDFDRPLSEMRAPVLALTGWLQYGDASVNIALSQGAADVIPPSLEVDTPRGRVPLDVVVGMPAGKTKTILVDLQGVLPEDAASRLYLTTTFEIRWDRAAVGERLAADAIDVRTVAPNSAELFDRGFSDIRVRRAGHPTTPAHGDLLERPPWRTQPRGWVTRFGEIEPLVSERDARLALLTGGDALELRFAADLPAPAQERRRTFFFESVGWDKDADHNVIGGDSVGPLPVIADDESWRLEWNTRWSPGRLDDRVEDRLSAATNSPR